RLELVVGPVELVDQQHGRRTLDGLQQGPAHQEALGPQVVLAGAGPQVQQLAGPVPLVQGLADIDALPALQSQQARTGDGGQHLGHLGLAHTRLAFEEQRAGHGEGQEDRRGQALVGQVPVLAQGGPDVVHRLELRGHTPASSNARRTSTRARWRRNSALALRSAGGSVPSSATAAASPAEAPDARAASTPLARRGTEPMLTRATPVPAMAATPTRAQSWARRVNFWNDQPWPATLGTRTSVSNSLGPRAVSRKPVNRSTAAISRSPPPGPRATTQPPSASTTDGRSDAGSPWASVPPSVPRCRTCGSPTCDAAWARIGA